MIEADGVKVAENTEEADWEKVRLRTQTRISEMKIALQIEKEVLKLAEKKVNRHTE